jgi:hypothetical protein
METVIYVSGLVFWVLLLLQLLKFTNKVLLNTKFYSWLNGSLLYLYHVRVVKKMVVKMKGTDKLILSEQIENIKKWKRDFWFGKRLKNLLVSELEKLLKE